MAANQQCEIDFVIARLRALAELFSNYNNNGDSLREELRHEVSMGNGLLLTDLADRLANLPEKA